MSGMEMRNGTWTSKTRARDASDIERLARVIIEKTDDPEVLKAAQRIKQLARDLQD